MTTLDLGGAYALLGFSVSGHLLYGYQTEGEQEFWNTPITYPRSGGSVRSIGKFSGQADPLAVSNGTTPTTAVAQDAGTIVQPGVDPQDRARSRHGRPVGSAAGLGTAGRHDPHAARLRLTRYRRTPGSWLGPERQHRRWPPQATVDSPLDLHLVLPAEPSVVQPRPTFTLPSGTYWQQFDGVRGTTVLLGLAAERAHESLYLGADELVAVDLSASRGGTLMAAVLIPTDAGLTGIHVAGWVTVRA